MTYTPTPEEMTKLWQKVIDTENRVIEIEKTCEQRNTKITSLELRLTTLESARQRQITLNEKLLNPPPRSSWLDFLTKK